MRDENERGGNFEGSRKVRAEKSRMVAIKTFSSSLLIWQMIFAPYIYFHPNQIHENIAKFIFMWGCALLCEGREKQRMNERRLSYFFHNIVLLSLEGKKKYHFIMSWMKVETYTRIQLSSRTEN